MGHFNLNIYSPNYMLKGFNSTEDFTFPIICVSIDETITLLFKTASLIRYIVKAMVVVRTRLKGHLQNILGRVHIL